MEDMYQKLYHMLFNACTDCVDALEEGEYDRAHMILIKAQRDCEEVYVSWEELHPANPLDTAGVW